MDTLDDESLEVGKTYLVTRLENDEERKFGDDALAHTYAGEAELLQWRPVDATDSDSPLEYFVHYDQCKSTCVCISDCFCSESETGRMGATRSHPRTCRAR
jgi:hypothetical protein